MAAPTPEAPGNTLAQDKAAVLIDLLNDLPDDADEAAVEEFRAKVRAVNALTPEQVAKLPAAPASEPSPQPQQHARQGNFLANLRGGLPLTYANPTDWIDTGETVGMSASGDPIRVWKNRSTGRTRTQISHPGTGRRSHVEDQDGKGRRGRTGRLHHGHRIGAAQLAVHFYRQLFSDLEEAGKPPSKECVHAAREELRPTGWGLARQANGHWLAIHTEHLPVQHARVAPGTKGAYRAVDSLGRRYLTDRRPGKIRLAKRPVVEARIVVEKLTPHRAAEALPADARTQADAIGALIENAHGDGAMHRIEELADYTIAALVKAAGRSADAQALRLRLAVKVAQLHHMADTIGKGGSDWQARAEKNLEAFRGRSRADIQKRLVQIAEALERDLPDEVLDALEMERDGLEEMTARD